MDSYHNTRDGEKYPAQYITGGYQDPRVTIWEPAKFVAAMQAANRSDKPVLFKINMDAGHFGTIGDEYYAESAEAFAFLFWQMGHPDFQPKK